MLDNPKLWWPNGYGEPNLYPVELQFRLEANSDTEDIPSRHAPVHLQRRKRRSAAS